MDIKEIIISQYLAVLEMLLGVVNQCPEQLWEDSSYKNPFWQVTFHALFYVHFYLQPNKAAFVPWVKYRDGSQHMEIENQPYTKEEIFEFFEICRQQVLEQVPILQLEAPCGFDWLPFNKLELQFYNIRHIQQHCGELCERLGVAENIEARWVGAMPKGK